MHQLHWLIQLFLPLSLSLSLSLPPPLPPLSNSLSFPKNKYIAEIWDVRARNYMETYIVECNRTCSSDLEFSVNNLWHLAVSCVNNGRSAAVKVLKHLCWGYYFTN
jgi:hypothetical protein